MPKYKVSVKSTTIMEFDEIEIEASDAAEAERMAMEMARDDEIAYDSDSFTVEYTIEGISEITEL